MHIGGWWRWRLLFFRLRGRSGVVAEVLQLFSSVSLLVRRIVVLLGEEWEMSAAANAAAAPDYYIT